MQISDLDTLGWLLVATILISILRAGFIVIACVYHISKAIFKYFTGPAEVIWAGDSVPVEVQRKAATRARIYQPDPMTDF